MPTTPAPLAEPLVRILEARHHDPFSTLGRHPEGGGWVVRAFLPQAQSARVVELDAAMAQIPGTAFFEWRGAAEPPAVYRIEWRDHYKKPHVAYDPYCFPPLLDDFDLYLFGEGRHWHAYRFLGANPRQVGEACGVLFAVWAPNAERISVVGDFNRWDGRAHPMRNRGASGVWELFIPGLEPGALYKFEVRARNGDVFAKTDPYARRFQVRPDNACILACRSEFEWADGAWVEQRRQSEWAHRPMSIYEVHLGSWQRDRANGFLDYRTLSDRLADYLSDTGFTHVELLPITEYPFDGSWGYQPIGYFAPSSRFGSPDDFRYMVDRLHRAGIGVILDWVPAHFPRDFEALGRFDGSPLYEHEDPRLGEHKDWGTFVFNYGRPEVRNFLLASAIYWLEEFHLDGLRVDAVASMLYLDYSREAGEWLPNQYGGRENLEAVEFLRHLNTVVHEQFPGTLMIAEESTAWPQVSRPTWLGGLGFDMKWNMGWMHDTLSYFRQDPIFRQYHHHLLTFGQLYSYTENFVLAFSHDEVVHQKASMLRKMPGDEWQRFASLRLLYAYMFIYPGKKLLFMGDEFGQEREWSEARPLDWGLMERPAHRQLHALVRDLNRLYRERPELHALDFDARGFDWIDCYDSSQSVLTFLRRDAEGRFLILALNFTPVPRHEYRIGVPASGFYRELLNSDAEVYGGSNLGNGGGVASEPEPWMGQAQSVCLTLPPLGALVLAPEGTG